MSFDKNTVIGFLLIIVVLVGFSYLNRPSKEQLEAQRRYTDSIAAVQQAQQQIQAATDSLLQTQTVVSENIPDSIAKQNALAKYGEFASSVQGEEQFATLENDLLKIVLSSKGGRIYSAQLKQFSDYQKDSLFLFDGDESSFSVEFYTANNHKFSTEDFYFDLLQTSPTEVTLRLKTDGDASLDFVYKLHPNDYLLDFNIVCHNLASILSPAMHTMDLQWSQKIRQQEQGRSFENRYAYLAYKFSSDDVEHLSESKEDQKNPAGRVKWIAFKDQFFSSALIAGDNFESSNLKSTQYNDGAYLKEFEVYASVPFVTDSEKGVSFNYFFGPNDYRLLRNYDKNQFKGQELELDKLVPMGWSVFRYISKWIIMPIFDWLRSSGMGLGLAIFLLTLIIRTLLFPLTYKSYLSSAKMRVLRPQIEALTENLKGQENAMARQQKTMELYRQVGINPMAGCLPMLIQMPFFFALFWLFPTLVALRGQSFLWAPDLSTYDAVIHWQGFSIPFLGNHLSLFCLLMTVTQVIYTRYSMAQTGTGQEQMPGMKYMMYLMPVFMLFFLNDYPAGLNYYYFVSGLISVFQTLAIRLFINEEKLLSQLEANKKKAKPKKKSGFMARLEEAQRKQQAMLREQQKKNSKRR